MMVVLVASLLAAAGPAGAQDGGVDPPAKAKKAPNPNKRVCKSINVTGSRLPQSTCHTQAEWDQIDQERQSAVTPFPIPTQGQH